MQRAIHHADTETVFGLSSFKAKVALETIQATSGHRARVQARSQSDLLCSLEAPAVEKLTKVFNQKGSEREKSRDGEIAKLNAKIDYLVVERGSLPHCNHGLGQSGAGGGR
jgi:hypothetical protein